MKPYGVNLSYKPGRRPRVRDVAHLGTSQSPALDGPQQSQAEFPAT
jgi:hypothetical protein